MNKEVISDRQGITILILYIFGSTLVMGTGGHAKNDAWLAIILGIIISIPIMFIYARILSRFPGKDLYDILEEVFGKLFGRVFMVLYIWFPFHLGALVLRNIGEFISTIGLQEAPKIIPIIIFSLICCYAVKHGIEIIARCSSSFIVIVFFLLILLNFLTVNIMDTQNLLPILENGFKPLLHGAFEAVSFPFAELVVFLMVFDSIKSPQNIFKVLIKALLLGGALVTFVAARNIMVLGAETAGTVYFPSYSAISRINVGNFLQRLEITVSIVFILSSFIKISICLLAASKGFSKLLGYKDYRFFVTPVGLLMVNLSYLIYDNIMEMFEWAQDIWPYYAFPFQVIFPLLIFIAIEIKTKLQNRKREAEEEAPV